MKRTLRLASVLIVSVLLAVSSSVRAFAPQSPPQEREKDSEASRSLVEIQASKRQPQNAKLYIKLGQAYWNGADYQPALEAFKQAAKLAPASAEVHNCVGTFLMGRSNLPDSAEVHCYGAALWYSGERQKALSGLKASIRLDPSAAASYALLGMAQREEGDFGVARVSLERAIALSPTTAATFIDLGILFLQQGQVQRGLAQFEAGLNASFSIPAPDWDVAITSVRNAISKGTAAPELHRMLGLLLGRKGNNSNEVLAEFREALRLPPEVLESFTRLDQENNELEKMRHDMSKSRKCTRPRRRS